MSHAFQSSVRVLSLNVQHASMIRAQRQVSWLSRISPDVVVLTEVPAGATGDLMAQWLRGVGYSVQLPDPGGTDRYRVLLAARGVLDPVDTGIAVMPHRLAAARVKHAGTGFEFAVAGLYVPSRGPAERRNVAKREFQDAVTACLAELPQRASTPGPVVITGDLNVVEPGHVPHYRVFGTWEYDFYRAFAASGFVDVFRLIHPDLVEHSWFGRTATDGTRNGYRFDHTFVTAEHRHLVQDCAYQHRPRHNELSDHAAMILTLRV
ncbi:endonuclease/exonuclease/phosphatase family protein [Nocardia otitidiscaviarum]|nr:endonuclease/exonuclease/phosphatase family protein [Nocardia otitidiscaviarum]